MRHLLLVLVLSSAAPSTLAYGQKTPPRIEFDVPSIVSCRDITTDEFANTHSLEKLLEVRFNVSSLVSSGSDRCIRELFILAYSPERSFEVVDFSPQTTLITEFASPIDESRNVENSSNAGINFSPAFEMAGKANLNANVSDREGKTLRTSKLPPKKLAVASGTQKRGTAVYFKLKPSTQSTLEGSHEVVLTVKVPVAWRADLMHVHCSGVSAWTEDGPHSKYRADFVIPVYLAADSPAKIVCEQFSDAELELRRSARTEYSKKSPAKKDLASKVSLFVKREILGKRKKPTPQSNWLGQVIFNNHSVAAIESQSGTELSDSAKTSVRKFRQCRIELLKLNR